MLLRAGERSARSAGARYLNRESFERATLALRRTGMEASPPPEVAEKVKPKLPTFKRKVPLGTPPDERRVFQPSEPSLRGLLPGKEGSPVRGARCQRYSRSPSPRPRQQAHIEVDGHRALPLLGTANTGIPTNTPILRTQGGVYRLACLVPHRDCLPQRGDVTDARLPRVHGDRLNIGSHPATIGRFAARTVWEPPRHAPPTAPRAEQTRAPAIPLRERLTSVPSISLQEQLSDPKKPLKDRLRSPPESGKRALMERMEIGLKERVSTKPAIRHKHAHNRPKKRLERLLRWEEEMRLEWEEFRWTDTEIDWIIDHEEMLHNPEDREDDNMNED
ncbi:hypothetical protein B0H14DRAFT_2655197 [Mycena olivaceomarginata]|nr:hypothetical protein B0H14DRAFT_2655197 [Mycena olivaceomarginata]